MIRKALATLFAGLLIGAAAAPQEPVAVPPVPVPPTGAAAAAPASPSATPALTATDVNAWLDGFFPGALKGGKIAGAQVVVVKDGQVLSKKGYGYADVAAKTVMDPDRNLMRIGSTSKLFTWIAVMQLVEAGKIDLNADVNRYIDFKIVPRGRAITMNDLMTHRAGFEEGIKDLLGSDPKLTPSSERYLKDNQRPQLYAAGEVPAYSNYGVALAGYIVQRVSGEPFEAYVQRHILTPLAMNRTTFDQPLPANLVGSMAKGYGKSDEQPGKFEMVVTRAAGSASTTGADMARFMIALLQDGRLGDTQVLRPETARYFHRPNLPPRPGFDAMAHGFFNGTRNGTPVIGHGGDTMVFHTDFNLLPEKGVGIYVSFNSRGENSSAYGVRERLFDLFMDRYFPGPKVVTPPAIATAAADAKALVGHYESSRRVETSFIRLFYLVQQDAVTANDDGTISLSSIEGKRFREVAPKLWHEVDGTRQLLVTEAGGRRAIADSANPISVLQAVPAGRNSNLFLFVAGTSLLVLLFTILTWPVAAWVRRSHNIPPVATGRAALVRRLTRIAAIADFAYLAGWYTVVAPLLQDVFDIYNATLDPMIRLLQVAAIIPLAAAGVGIWNAVITLRGPYGWGVRVRSVIVALALLGFLWMARVGGLIAWGVNY